MKHISKGLVRRAKKGNKKALERILKYVEGTIVFLAKKCPEQATKDIVGDMKTKVWHAVKKYDMKQDISFNTYLYSVLFNYVNTELRKHYRKLKGLGEEEQIPDFEINESSDLLKFRFNKKDEKIQDQQFVAKVTEQTDVIYRDFVDGILKCLVSKAINDKDWKIAYAVFMEKLDASEKTVKIAEAIAKEREEENIGGFARVRVTNRVIAMSLGVSRVSVQNALRDKIRPIVYKMMEE